MLFCAGLLLGWAMRVQASEYYQESDGESTTTLATFQDKVTLTFTPSETADYVIIASAMVTHDSTSHTVEVQLKPAGTAYAIEKFRPLHTSDYYAFGAHKVVSLTGSTEYTFKIQYRSLTAAQTAKIKQARIIARKVSDLDYGTQAEPTESTNSTTTYVTKVTLDYTALSTEDYLVIATADITNSNIADSTYIRLREDTTDIVADGKSRREPTIADDYYTFATIKKRSLTATTAYSYTLDYKTSTGGTAKIKNARITVIRLSDLGDIKYAESEAISSDDTTGWIDKISLTDNFSAGDYLVVASAMVKPGAASTGSVPRSIHAQLLVDGPSHAYKAYRAKDGLDYVSFFVSKRVTLTEASHTIKIQFKTDTLGRTVYIQLARIVVIPSYAPPVTKPSASDVSGNPINIGTNTKVRIDYTLIDAQTDECNYSTSSTQVQWDDNSEFFSPTDCTISGTTTGADSSPGGTAHTATFEPLYWDCGDITDGTYYVRIKPHDGTEYADSYAVSSSFTIRVIDNVRDIVINELMWMGDTTPSYGADCEWVELRNATGSSIPLDNMQLTKLVGGTTTTDMELAFSEKSIAANGYFLIADYDGANSKILDSVTPDLVVGPGSTNDTVFALVNTQLQIKLWNGTYNDPQNTPIDTADDGVGAPFEGDNTDKYSMERKATPGDGAVSTNWQTSVDRVNWDSGATEKGTPRLSNSQPTLVGLADFQALSYERGVWLWWRTASEVGNAGFNLYRSENRNGPYTRLNDSLIPGLLYSVTGKVYWYLDSDVFGGTTYYYKLEDVDCFGNKTQHGPVWATPGIDSDNDGIPDGWEERYGLNPFVNDGGLDPDNDDFTNYEEFLNDTNPFIPDIEGVTPPRPPEEPIVKKEGIEIIESTESGVTLELTTEEFDEEEKIEEGITYQRVSIPGYIHGHSSEIGKPQVPMKGVLLGVPTDSAIEISILDTEYTTLSGYNLYPVPDQEAKESGKIKYVAEIFTKDEAAYNSDAFYPDNLAELGFTGYKRDQKVVQIKLYPIQFNPVTRELKFYKKIRVRLDFSEVDQLASSPVHLFTDSPLHLSLFTTPAWADSSPSFPSDFSAPAYKISLSQDGIYRLTHTYLTDAGMDLSASLSTFKIYNKIEDTFEELPIYIYDGGVIGVFDSGDYIEFYGKAKDTKYTTTNVYWLTSGGVAGSRISEKNNTGSSEEAVSNFFSLKEEEEDWRYFGLCSEDESYDRHFFKYYASETYKATIDEADNPQDYTITLKDVASPAGNARIRVTLCGYFDISPENNNHAKVYVNKTSHPDPVGEVSWDGQKVATLDAYFSQSWLNSGAGSQDQTITIESIQEGEYDAIYLDTIKIDYYRSFVAEDDSLKFSNETSDDHRFEISGFTTNDIEIFDITDENNPKHITFTVEGYTAKFNDTITEATTYLAQTPSTPTSIALYSDSGIHSSGNGADYIIITHEKFYDDDNLTSLVNHREAKGLRVKKVKVNDIYNEFNHGIFDSQAIKDFLTYAYTNWQKPEPTYCLLVGDATYDYKDNKGYEPPEFAHLPTYLSYTAFAGETANDNWYSWISGDDYIPDIYIGRFPVRTTDELKYIVSKIRTYEETASTNTWENKILLVADDGDVLFETTNNSLASGLCQVTPVYLAQPPYNGDTSTCKSAVIAAINDGAAIVNYVGHGAQDRWAGNGTILQSPDDINSLTNGEKLPFFVSMTCLNSYFTHLTTDSIAEELLKAENKGAIGVFTSSGESSPSGQKILDEGLFQAFFGGTTHILGDAIAQAHTTFMANGSGYEDIPETFSLLGDPALELKIPFPAGDSHTHGLTCPIATITYGTSMAEEVEVFRNFRDECLLTNRKGRAFVRFYYHHSPPISRFIEKRKALKPIIRAGLKPILWLTKRAIKSPHKYPIWE